MFLNEEEIIPKDSTVWVNTHKKVWEGRVIKIPFSDLLEDSDYLKLKWIKQKRKLGF